MNMLGRILGGLGLVTFSCLYSAACVAPVDPEPEEITPEGSSDVVGEEEVAESADAIGTCHGYTTCPNPKSCGSWSTYTACGTTCVYNRECGGCGPIHLDPDCVPDGTKGLRQFSEQFRACVLQDGSTCMEYNLISSIVDCGC